MGRRKHEFKPDKMGAGFLSKLYLTPRQRLIAACWLLFSLVLLGLSLLQDVILCRVSIYGATTDLVSTGILLLCLMLPTESCAVFALVGSLFFYFSGSSAGPYAIIFLTALGIFLNIFRYSFLRRSFGSIFLCSAFALLVYEMLLFLVGLFLGHATLQRFSGFCITAGLSIAAMPLIYPLFRCIGKIGGDSWKE